MHHSSSYPKHWEGWIQINLWLWAAVLAYGLFYSYSVPCHPRCKTENCFLFATRIHLPKVFVLKALAESFGETRFTIKTVKSNLKIILFLPKSYILVDFCFSALTKTKFLSEPLNYLSFCKSEDFVSMQLLQPCATHSFVHLPFSFWQPYLWYLSPNWHSHP